MKQQIWSGHGGWLMASSLRMMVVVAAAMVLATPACAEAPDAEPLEGVALVEAFPNLSFQRSLYLTPVPDGSNRLAVVEQGGRVLLFENNPDVTMDQVHEALDIRNQVRAPGNRGHNEEGLLGLAFHPEFTKNGYVFLHYSASNPQRGVISRFEMDEQRENILPESERMILEVEQPAGNHNGGMIAFGPDGYLYISLGDGGGAGDPWDNGQDLQTLLGAILRIDVDRTESDRNYAIPDDNPFIDDSEARDEIWAYGLRNVWRFSFHPETGDMWAGDVCQNAWEKIYRILPGGNHGWPYMEGAHDYDGLPEGMTREDIVDIVIEHPHQSFRSITGGYFYQGERVPQLQGLYVYGDYVTGAQRALDYDADAHEVTAKYALPRGRQIASYGVDEAGELYVVQLMPGRIYKFVSEDDSAN